MAEFERALTETRASVTPEMEREYEQIQDSLKQDAHSADRHRLHLARHAHAAGAEGPEAQGRPRPRGRASARRWRGTASGKASW